MIFPMFTFAFNILGEILSHPTYKAEVNGSDDVNWLEFQKRFCVTPDSEGQEKASDIFYLRQNSQPHRNIWVDNISWE